jgi:hypothetical protein
VHALEVGDRLQEAAASMGYWIAKVNNAGHRSGAPTGINKLPQPIDIARPVPMAFH